MGTAAVVAPPVVVIAPDKFKGSLSAPQAAQAISRGVKRAIPNAECRLCPMADGGEGTVAVFVERGATRKEATVRGPLGERVEAAYALNGVTAIVEMSAASGLGLLQKSQYDPMHADTFGTGELIKAAIEAGAERVILGIGGSATCDAGTGMLRALGVRFLDERGEAIDDGMAAFERLKAIDLARLDERLKNVAIDVAVDVDNPLCGEHGAARTFAPQKGATPQDVAVLDRVLGHIADVAQATLRCDWRDTPGAGAAGGLGFALVAFLEAHMYPGVELIARECGLPDLLKGAALCLTGEGKIDEQTLHGKTVFGVARLAREQQVPVTAFGGIVDASAAEQLAKSGVNVFPIAPPGTPFEESVKNASALLERAAEAAVGRVSKGRRAAP